MECNSTGKVEGRVRSLSRTITGRWVLIVSVCGGLAQFSSQPSWAQSCITTNVAVASGSNVQSVTAEEPVCIYSCDSAHTSLVNTALLTSSNAGTDLDAVALCLAGLDYGDAPDSLGTLLASDGPRHMVFSTLQLGALTDTEPDGQPSPGADGDAEDEDGIAFPGALAVGGSYVLQVSVLNNAAEDAYLNAWIDFNRDLDFVDAGEQIAIDQVVATSATSVGLSFTVPGSAANGPVYSRLRLCMTASTCDSPVGFAAAGEVEDYLVTIDAPTAALITSTLAYRDGNDVIVEFSTGYEARSSAFEVYRVSQDLAEYEIIHQGRLPALLASPQGGVYRVVDQGTPSSNQLYMIVEHERDGTLQAYGPYPVDIEHREDKSPMGSNFEARPHVSDRVISRLARGHDVVARKQKERSSPSGSISRQLEFDVTGSGLYQLSASDIASVSELPVHRVSRMIAADLVALSHDGEPVAWRAVDPFGSGLYFFGEAIDSLYTELNTYKLELEKQGLRLEQTVVPGNAGSFDSSFQSLEHFEEDVIPLITATLETGVDYWYWDVIDASSSENTKTFEVSVHDATGYSDADIQVHLFGASDGAVEKDHHAIVSLNGTVVGEIAWGGVERASATFDFDASLLTSTTTLEVKGVLDDGSTSSIFFIDAFDLNYERFARPIEDWLHLSGDGTDKIAVAGFRTPDIVAWDLTDPKAPSDVRIKVVNGPNGTDFTALLVRDRSLSPYFVGTLGSARRVDNLRRAITSHHLLASGHVVEHLVVAPEAWLGEAEGLSSFHEANGLDSMAISLEEVYSTFSGGIRTPWALRDLLLYASENWQTSPEFVLLAGRGTFDPRNILGGNDSFIPVVLAGTPYGLVASDNRLADLHGDDLIPDLAIGRLPIVSGQELALYADRLQALATSAGSWRGEALFLADNPDHVGDFWKQSTVVRETLTRFRATSIFVGAQPIEDARAELQDTWNAGVRLVNYVGHGGVTTMAAEGLFVAKDTALLVNEGRLPIVSALTCSIGRSDIPNIESVAEALITDTDGGAIAVWGAATVSMAEQASHLNLLYAKAVQGGAETLGEAILKALREFVAEGGAQSMVDSYGLLGDPAVGLD